MDAVAILIRALGDYEQTVDTLLARIKELEAQLAEKEPPNGAAA